MIQLFFFQLLQLKKHILQAYEIIEKYINVNLKQFVHFIFKLKVYTNKYFKIILILGTYFDKILRYRNINFITIRYNKQENYDGSQCKSKENK